MTCRAKLVNVVRLLGRGRRHCRWTLRDVRATSKYREKCRLLCWGYKSDTYMQMADHGAVVAFSSDEPSDEREKSAVVADGAGGLISWQLEELGGRV